jgi:hypothetical protein
MKNPNCPCAHKECPIHGVCEKCRALHPKPRKTYCQGSAAHKAFINFASNVNFLKKIYNTIVIKKLKKLYG